MKTLKITSALVCLMLGSNAWSQTKPDSLGLPGDNFDLYGALELFKKAETPEAFEKAINSNTNEVNNLDLDGDGKVDYVKVIDKQNGDAHTLVLQVDVSESEKQDVAVIEVEKTGKEDAHVQIVGDEDLYGKDYIIEPQNESADQNANARKAAGSQGSGGSNDDVYAGSDDSNRQPANVTNNNTTNNYYNSSPNPNPPVVVNVWAWPSVRYIYGPSYAVWVSPWYWRTYPVWWDPWAPVYWRYHYRRAWRYHHPYYHRVSYYRSPRTHDWYYGRRTSSQMVRSHRESGFYGQRQMMYKNNTPRSQRYNNRPAYQRQNGQSQYRQPQRSGSEHINGGHRQEANPTKMQNSQPVRHQQNPGNGQIRQTEPVKQQPSRQTVQPRQDVPRQQVQPRQDAPRQQVQPRQQQSVPRQQMRSSGGGAGHRQVGGGSGHHSGGGRPR